MKVFVTGGSGFVGRATIRTLVGRGAHVVALARSEAAELAVTRVGARTIVRGSLESRASLHDGMKGCDWVVHAAARISDDRRGLEASHRTNVVGTTNALSAAKAVGVRRFIHVGTDAILNGYDEVRNVDESVLRSPRPIGTYASTKALAHRAVVEASSDSMHTVVVVPRFVWGEDDTTMLPKLAEAVERGRFRWVDHGDYLTSTCHVDHLANAIVAAGSAERCGASYFVTDGEPVRFVDFVTRLLATRGIRPDGRSVPGWVASVLARVSDLAWRWLPLSGEPPITPGGLRVIGREVTLDGSKAVRELGLRPSTTVDRGLERLSRR